MLALLLSLPSFFLLTGASVSPTPLPTREVVNSGNSFALPEDSSVEWTVNDKFITFTITLSSRGWFLLGWMKQGNQSGSSITSLSQTRADVIVLYRGNKALDCNTLRGMLHKDKHKNDLIVKLEHQKKDGKNITVWEVTRKLDTGNGNEDIAIEPGIMLLFGARGKTDVQHLKDIMSSANDPSIKSMTVHFIAENPTVVTKTNNTSQLKEFLGEIVKEHWIAVLVGGATVLTACITLVVYCCFRKKKASKNKKVKVSFFKEEADIDEEARVALISTT